MYVRDTPGLLVERRNPVPLNHLRSKIRIAHVQRKDRHNFSERRPRLSTSYASKTIASLRFAWEVSTRAPFLLMSFT